MATVKISDLPAATVPLDGTELVPIVQSSTTDRVSVANLTAGRTVNASALAATGTVSGATVTATGTVSGATVTATGTVSGATVSGTTVTATGTVSGATVTATGTVSGATVSGTTVTATGTVSGATVTATGTVSGATVTATGTVSGATVSGTTVNVGLGTVSAPSIAPTGDSNTGIYFPGADRIAFAEGGVQVGEFDANGNFLFNSGYGSVGVAYGCRAWVNFNGTGTVAIRASGNVSSITDNGVGDYTVNFTAAMPDANYCCVVNSHAIGNTVDTASVFGSTPYATGNVRVKSGGSAGVQDANFINVNIFR